MVPTRTITGTEQILYAPVGGQPMAVPVDLSNTSISAYRLEGGSYGPAISGRGTDAGTFQVAGVPATGNYLLHLGGVPSYYGSDAYYWISDANPDLSFLDTGRPDRVPLTADATLTLDLSGAGPWSDGDWLEVYSAGAADYAYCLGLARLPPPAPDAGDTTALGALSFLNNGCGATLSYAVDGTKGDKIIVSQLETLTTSSGQPYLAVTHYAETASLSVGAGQNVKFTSAFTSVPLDQSVSCDIRWTQFDPFFATSPAGLTPLNAPVGYVDFEGQAATASAGLATSYLVDFALLAAPVLTADMLTGPIDFGFVAADQFAPFANVQVLVPYRYLMPNTVDGGQIFLYVGFSQNYASPAAMCSGPVVPRLSPVPSITINGVDASHQLLGVGLTPTIAWTEPALGTAGVYLLKIFQYAISGSGNNQVTSNTKVARIETRETSVVLPPGILKSGQTYALQLVAGDSTSTLGVDPIGVAYSFAASSTFSP